MANDLENSLNGERTGKAKDKLSVNGGDQSNNVSDPGESFCSSNHRSRAVTFKLQPQVGAYLHPSMCIVAYFMGAYICRYRAVTALLAASEEHMSRKEYTSVGWTSDGCERSQGMQDR